MKMIGQGAESPQTDWTQLLGAVIMITPVTQTIRDVRETRTPAIWLSAQCPRLSLVIVCVYVCIYVCVYVC